MTLTKSFLLVVLAGLCALWATSIVTMPTVYKSVHDIGYRVGMVLPQGFDPGSQLKQDQTLRVAAASTAATPTRPPASMRANPGQAQPMREGLSERFWIAGLVVGCIVLALGGGMFVRWYNWRDEVRDLERPHPLRVRLVRAALVLLPVGVLMAIVFVSARVFWTGVDDAFIARSTMVRPDSVSIHITGNTTLSMNSFQMFMLYMAVVLTMGPLMFRLALFTMGDNAAESHSQRRGVLGTVQRVLEWIAVKRGGALDLTLVLYVLLMTVLWTAPWSTTIARALWASPAT